MRGITASELRAALRGLSRSPTLTICAVLCLALGIGATTAIASALSRALLQSFPFQNARQLVAVHRITPHSGPLGTWPQSAPNYMDLARQSKQVVGLSALSWGTALLNLPSEAVQASQLYVTGGTFQTLGAAAQLGRLIAPDDDRADAPDVAVLSDEIWRSRFGADPAIVGRALSIDGAPATIVGIAPRDFRIPHGNNLLKADVWSPMRYTPRQLTQRDANYLLTFGRLAHGATAQSAEAELRALFANLVAAYPELAGENVRAAPLVAENVGAVRKPLLLLFGAVCMVLLIAMTNVAALLLARGVQRRREMAVRTALGASRMDVLRGVLLESFIITALAAVLGIALAAAGVKTIGLLAGERMLQLHGLSLDPRVLTFALVLSIVTAIGCAAAPAWRSASVDPQDALRGGRGGGAGGGREHHRALRALVVLEISLSLVLLIGAGLVLKGFAKLLDNDPGFDSDRVLALRVSASHLRYPNRTGSRNFIEPALAAIQNVPRVAAAGAISALPYSQWGNNSNMRHEGQRGNDPDRLPRAGGR